MAEETKLRESDDIQGDVIAGFKKDRMTLLFLKFEDPARARTWVKRLASQISTTRQVATFNAAFRKARQATGGDDPQTLKATWTNVSFTYEGLKVLVGGKDPLPSVRRAAPWRRSRRGPTSARWATPATAHPRTGCSGTARARPYTP